MSDDLFTAFLPMMIIGLMILSVALWLCPKWELVFRSKQMIPIGQV